MPAPTGPLMGSEFLAQTASLSDRVTALENLFRGGPIAKDFLIAHVADHGLVNLSSARAAEVIRNRRVNLLVHGGDNDYAVTKTADSYRQTLSNFLMAAPAHAMIIGNHDREGDPSASVLRSTFKRYMHADLLDPTQLPVDGQPYFAVDLQRVGLDCKLLFGDTCTASADTTHTAVMPYGNTIDSTQGRFLRNEALTCNRAIAFLHHPWATARADATPPTDRYSEKYRWFAHTSVQMACFGHTHVGAVCGVDQDGIMMVEASGVAQTIMPFSGAVQYRGDAYAHRSFETVQRCVTFITISLDDIHFEFVDIATEEVVYRGKVASGSVLRSTSGGEISRAEFCQLKSQVAQLARTACADSELPNILTRLTSLERACLGSNTPTY